MKREARNHSKMKRLCRRLDIPLYQAIGILETLWHVTAVEAWRGDIGKLSNEDIALSLDYRGDENALIEALTKCGWLDESKEYRLLVHDWREHADSAVQKRAKRAEESGQVGFYLEMSGQVKTNRPNGSLPEPEPVPEPAPEPVCEPAVLDASLHGRILCETVGCFDMREQSALQQVMDSHGRHAGKTVEGARDAMVARWKQYSETPAEKFEWQWGSSYKFFMSGKWDKPETWPWKSGMSPPNPKRKNADFERTQKLLSEQDDARREWEARREADALRSG